MDYLKFVLLAATFLMGCTPTASDREASSQKQRDTVPAPVPPGRDTAERWPGTDNVKEYFTEYGKEHPETLVKLSTRLGDIHIRLYEDTPLHRANFIHHIKRSLYQNTIFYRVIPGFMIQGGNSDNEECRLKRKNIPAYYIPSEVRSHHVHKRGAVAMAMSYVNNPEMKSAQYSFYIVIGNKFTPAGLDAVESEYGITIPKASREVYTTLGGTPHLDGKHTVFGEVVKGMDVVEAIALEERDSGDWPVKDVVITYTVSE